MLCEFGKRKLQSTDNQLTAILLCCLVRKMNEREKQIVMEEPTLLLVITGGPMAYTRPDGVKVIPLACLKD